LLLNKTQGKNAFHFIFFLSSDVFLISLQGKWIHTKKNKNKELHLMKTSFDGVQKGSYDEDRDGVLNLAEESA